MSVLFGYAFAAVLTYGADPSGKVKLAYVSDGLADADDLEGPALRLFASRRRMQVAG